MMALLAGMLATAATAVGLLALFYLAVRRPVEFVALLLVAWIATVALRDSLPMSLVVSGFQVSLADALAFVMALVGVARMVARGVRGLGAGLALALFLLLAVHVGRGVDAVGLQHAVSSTRSTLYFVTAMIYATTVPGGWGVRVWKALILAGSAVALLAIPFWLSGGLGSADVWVIRNGEAINSRPVVAAGALLVVQAAILALALRWPSRRSAAYLALLSGIVVLLLQHRTVWVAGLAVLAVGFFAWAARAGRRADRTAFAVLGASLLLLPVAVFGIARTGPLVRSVQEVQAGNSTLAWRTTGWRELLESHDSAADVAVGVPSGASFDRRLAGQEVDVSAHDGFLEAYLRFGLPGVVTLVALGLTLWRGRRRIGAAVGISGAAVALLLLTQLAFSIAYSLGAVQGVIDGVLISGLATAPARARVGARPVPLAPRVAAGL